ncbi:hypothetical protein G195_008532 [Phytophthora kernoviae 00238/432]|uniref:ABC transporter domain-containing protein n=1 Tax=Phytophthora kernoviae 00238/432 TaxID=1284355 RepID=A0A8J4SB05_9STRA|nr:hypothetical protein G195_008532 [Phytophthora kernoviae 00238/432]
MATTHANLQIEDAFGPVGSAQKAARLAVDVGDEENASDTSTASLVPTPMHKQRLIRPDLRHHSFQRVDRFCSGGDAVLHVAGHVSANVFEYPLLKSDENEQTQQIRRNARARVVTLEIRPRAADAVRGALAVGASASALVPSQTLPLFLPSMFQMAQSSQQSAPAVFHVTCEVIRRDMAVASSYEPLYALQHSGALLLNSASPQECHDLAVVAHVAAQRLHKLFVHFYDGARVARELAKVETLTEEALQTLTALEASATNTPTTADVAEQVQSVMDDLFHVLQRQYRVYEYFGADDAEYVVVVVGEAAAALKQAAAYEQLLGGKVGVVQVRLLQPWSHALFARALPATVKRVVALENVAPSALTFQRGLMTQNLQVFFQSSHWRPAAESAPVVVTGVYGGVFRNSVFSVGMGRAVLRHVGTSSSRRSFVVAKSEELYDAALVNAASESNQATKLDVIFGESLELEGSAAYTKQFLFYGFDDVDSETSRAGAETTKLFESTLGLLNKNPSTRVNAVVTHSAGPEAAVRPVSTLEVRVALDGGNSPATSEPVEQADVVVVTRPELLAHYDVALSVKRGGKLLVLTGWKTSDDIDERAAFKQQVASREIQLLVVDANELATRVEDDAVAAVGPLTAFFKASGLYDERVVLALLEAQFPAEKHVMLRSFVAAVWGDVATLMYPSVEWLTATDVDTEVAVQPLTAFSNVATSKVPFANSANSVASSSSKTAGKRRSLAGVSRETKTAWQLMFPSAFEARHDVRAHVTDIVTVTKWERLTPEDYSRNVFHIEMDTTNTAIKYRIGEALAVFAHNDEKEVVKFLQSYNVEPEALVSLPVAEKKKKGEPASGPSEETLTYFQLFSHLLDIFGRPSKKFYQALLERATDEKEKTTLTALLDADGKDEYKRRVDETVTFAELLEEFPSARPTTADLLTLVPRIKPRHYSIASSMKMNPTSVHLLIVVHDWTTPSGKYRIGQATEFLSAGKVGQKLSVSVCSSVMKLPTNPEDPIVMAGLGTGMAPFRAFIQERAFLRSQGVKVGPVALYFGSRHKAKEYLYGDELDAYERDGLVTYLRCAFSRDQAHKVYIQDKIAEDKEILADLLLRQNGHFYLCGPTWPVADVREALVGSFMEVGGLDRRQANATIERMREEGRYVLESDSSGLPAPMIGYENGKTLMARGPLELHEHMASSMEKALGDKTFPQMEVRFRDVSISANIMVKNESAIEMELPTLMNEMMKSIRSITATKRTVKKQILKQMSGVFKPGTITLVLGQPGSGKSSLMKLLSGRFPNGKNVTIAGEVVYNGMPVSELRKRLPQFVSYVPQRDKHNPELTAKETLEFAHACCGKEISRHDEARFVHGSPQENREALEAAQAMVKHHPDVVIQQLGLENCQNTIVGDAMIRGVSGGERKRVTTGEMEFGNTYVKMMDEISTGLDSAATFDIITTQRSIAKKFRKTVVISLLQPSPEVFALFDDVMILNDGHVMYHGRREEALSYFESLGFKCPPRRDVADFLMDMGTNKQGQYEVKVEHGCTIPRAPSEFAEAFKCSSIFIRVLEELESPVRSDLVQDMTTYVKNHPEFNQNFLASTSLLMKRQVTITKREMSALIMRMVMSTTIALLCSSVYYQFDSTDAQLAMGIIFESILNLSVGQAAQIPTVMAAREVFYKQRGANFFRTASYVLSSSATQVPPIILESLVFSSIVYWMCGFLSSFWSFFVFLLILCLINFALSAFFFLLASASPNLNVANPLSSVAILFFTLFAGYTITKDQIPDYLIWIYWINPAAWGVRALAVNQYINSHFDECVYDGIDYCTKYGMTMGEYSLNTYQVPSEKFWLWYGLIYLAITYVFFVFLSVIALEYHQFESPENVVLDTEIKGKAMGDYVSTRTPRSSPSVRDESVLSVGPSGEKNFVPVTVAFKDLWYTVPDPVNPKKTIDLLKGIHGYALPGTITALMGSSGAGKTTLMDVIAGRKTGGKIRGDILLNGHPATDLAIRRSTGYCEQMDIHSESSTIREALVFSAFLRQGADVSDQDKYEAVDDCLNLLDLHSIADQVIRGSSVEQMKRLTIGVELAAQPSVLFLDEPTSGLDARSAKLIMDGVRKVADTGRTIMCTIHQPSLEVFEVFDSLLLLKRGGEMVFAGDLGQNARKMSEYFESIDGVAKLEVNYNPATWMLEVIGAGVGNSKCDATDFVEIFKSSAHFDLLQANLKREGVSRPSPSVAALEYGDKRAATELTQMKFLLKRFRNLYWRTASFNLTRFVISLGLGFCFGITYIGAEYTSYSGVNSGLGMVYLVMTFMGLVSFNGLIPIAAEERVVYYRERAAQTYSALWYFFGLSVVEIPYVVVAVFLFLVPFFPMVGFTGVGAFLICWLALTLHMLFQAYTAVFLVFLLPNLEIAEIAGVLLNLVSFLFSGFSPPASALPSATTWLYNITTMTYSIAVMSTVVFGECSSEGDIGCNEMTNAPPALPDEITVKSYLETNFLMKRSELWRNCGFLVIFVLVFGVLALLAMRFLNYQKR